MPSDATRIYQSLVVQRYTDVSWREWIAATSRADDGRDPTADHTDVKSKRRERPSDD